MESGSNSNKPVDAAEGRVFFAKAFCDDIFVELTALTAFENLSSKFNAALGVPTAGLSSPAARSS